MSADKNLPLILADECVGTSTVAFLTKLGYDIIRIQEIGFCGKKDPEILQWATKNDRILLTEDVGFGNILQFPPKIHNGIIVLRIRRKPKIEVFNTLASLLKNISSSELKKTLVIVEAGEYRIRRS